MIIGVTATILGLEETKSMGQFGLEEDKNGRRMAHCYKGYPDTLSLSNLGGKHTTV